MTAVANSPCFVFTTRSGNDGFTVESHPPAKAEEMYRRYLDDPTVIEVSMTHDLDENPLTAPLYWRRP